tara:strand:- start:93958 stop:94206 length:249 start_codon:yes stop_codon:yes gene_type:complete
MTEKELIEFGFKKDIIPDSESQNGYDYYYYTLEIIQDIVLVSSESDEIEDDEWGVFFSDSDCEIWDPKLLKELIDVFNKIKG